MTYNLSWIANSTTFLQFAQRVNTELMMGWFGVLILISITMIALIAFIQTTNNPAKSIGAASFIAFGLCLLLRAIALVPDLALFITLIGAGAGVAFAIKSG